MLAEGAHRLPLRQHQVELAGSHGGLGAEVGQQRDAEAGEQLVESTRGAFAQIAQSFAGVKDLARLPSGVLRVTAPVALARQQIVPRLADFLRAHPEVRIELEMSDRLVSLAQEGFDLALRHVAAPPDTHVAWPLCTTRSWLVASRAYLRRAGVPAAPQDLAGHDCLHYLRPGDTTTWTFAPAQGGEPVSVPVRGVFSANNSEALREAALAGLGIALLPDFSAQAAVQSGKLQLVLPQWKPVGAFGEHLYAIRPYSPVVPRAVQAFIGYWRTALENGFPIP